ncbi:MAG: hypothetical protein H6702_13635 [Myxococcales bacterium]|nr:hypothetical protein [Myxococcales bacterium]
MLRLAWRVNRWRLLVGILFAGSALVWLPPLGAPRLWCAAAALTLTPWLVLGRERARADAGWGRAARRARRAAALIALELALPAGVVVLAAAVGAGGQWAPALALAVWGLAGLASADALDRRRAEGGAAWLGWLAVALVVWSAPLWLAPWYGRTAIAPALASSAVGYHPAGMALAAAGLPTLQDPWFYDWSLSGVVEALPTPWYRGVTAWAVVAALGAVAALRTASGNPARRF